MRKKNIQGAMKEKGQNKVGMIDNGQIFDNFCIQSGNNINHEPGISLLTSITVHLRKSYSNWFYCSYFDNILRILDRQISYETSEFSDVDSSLIAELKDLSSCLISFKSFLNVLILRLGTICLIIIRSLKKQVQSSALILNLIISIELMIRFLRS